MVVLKLEPVEGNDHTLEHEFFVYKKLNGRTGIPSVHWFSTESGFNVMALDHLGPSLEDFFVRSGFQFLMKTVLLLAGQLISKFDFWGHNWWANMCCVQLYHLQYIHFCNFVHRNLKPGNIVMGIGNQTNLVYLIDFGLLKEFRDPSTHKHIPYKKGVGFMGTPTFASIHSHLGLELGRWDDLESLAYILFYFLWGFLPWQGLRKDKAICESKHAITTHKLFLDLPVEFRTFFEHYCSLSFNGKPNYDHFYDLFGNLLLQEGSQIDMAFDWDVILAGGKNRWGCASMSKAIQHKGDYSPKHHTW